MDKDKAVNRAIDHDLWRRARQILGRPHAVTLWICPRCGQKTLVWSGTEGAGCECLNRKCGLAYQDFRELVEDAETYLAAKRERKEREIKCKRLADVAARFARPKYPISPMEALFQLLARSSSFVHFATWNITDTMLGALTMLATRIPVRGIVGVMDARQVDVLGTFQDEVCRLDIMVFGNRSDWADAPHQKLLVFDGLVAIEGSTNLTHIAWMKAAEGRERVRIVTELDEVRELNNKYFATYFRSRLFTNDTEISDVPF